MKFDGFTTYIEVPPSYTLNEVPQKSFKVEALTRGVVKSDEEEYLIGNDNSRYIKYPLLCKQGWDFDISYNNARAWSTSLWTWKNRHMYSWVKRYSNLWTKVNLEVDVRNRFRKLTINDVEYGSRFGIQKSKNLHKNILNNFFIIFLLDSCLIAFKNLYINTSFSQF